MKKFSLSFFRDIIDMLLRVDSEQISASRERRYDRVIPNAIACHENKTFTKLARAVSKPFKDEVDRIRIALRLMVRYKDYIMPLTSIFFRFAHVFVADKVTLSDVKKDAGKVESELVVVKRFANPFVIR